MVAFSRQLRGRVDLLARGRQATKRLATRVQHAGVAQDTEYGVGDAIGGGEIETAAFDDFIGDGLNTLDEKEETPKEELENEEDPEVLTEIQAALAILA